ncbi:hypothetical protein GCM10010124_05670 [Pilimelia terevasa]|uniref:Uncharacterized protein n=1 Tax=Pilimelia terevasa TaxID=53372 RepID=A0A8J3BKN2_9ACTN|nr:hypothetical protein [Pilimelia terevasa]GGK15917.1 hypothetical protein GCM10010124_05670 [Pilimelia terevasa]
MRIVLEDVSDELGRELFQMLADRGVTAAQVTHEWTPGRAVSLLRDLPYRARLILREVVDRGGSCSAAVLRGEDGGTLRGQTGSITKAITRGVRAGWLPEGMPAPVVAQYDSAATSYQRTSGFVMDERHLDAFRSAFATLDADPEQLRADAKQLSADPVDRAEVEAVQHDMESLRAW